MSADALPPTLGPYRVLCRIARGSTAEILLARGLSGGRVALKRALRHLASDPDVRRGLEDEGRWLSGLKSPHVVGLIEALEVGGEPLLSLEYIHGVSLAYLLDRWGRGGERPDAGVALGVASDALRGLSALHEAGLVHGDVNPRNILVGNDGVARLCDLEFTGPERAGVGVFRGTAAYAAPEVWRGDEQTRRSDLFSLGVVLWESSRGERLFKGASDLATLNNVLEAPIAPVDEGRPDLAPIRAALEAALQRDPALRPASAADFLALCRGAPRADRPRVAGVVEGQARDLLSARLAL